MTTPKEEKKKRKERLLRDKSIEKALQENIKPEDLKYLIQPISVTLIKGDLSAMKTTLMVELIDKFQDTMIKQIQQTAEERKKHKALFTDAEMQKSQIVRIPLRDLDVRPDAYKDLHQAAIELRNLSANIPEYDENGNLVKINYTHIFNNIAVPVESAGSDGEKYKYKSGKRRLGYVEMEMGSKVMNEWLRIDNRYTKFIKSVTRSRRCTYTSRIYMFISTYKFEGYWDIAYEEFHKLLGFTLYDEKKDEYYVAKYGLFCDVKKRVLDPAQKELKELADQGKSDCYFEYEPIYPHGKKRGLPNKLHFTIYQSELGKAVDDYNMMQDENIKITNFLREAFHFSVSSCKRLMMRVNDLNRGLLLKKMEELKAFIDNPDNNISQDKIDAYAWTSLNNFLDKHEPRVEEIVSPQEEQAAPEAQQEMQPEQVMQPDTKDMERWSRVLNGIRPRVEEEQFNIWFGSHMKPSGFENNTLIIDVPTNFYANWISKNYSGLLTPLVRAEWGSDVRITFHITNK